MGLLERMGRWFSGGTSQRQPTSEETETWPATPDVTDDEIASYYDDNGYVAAVPVFSPEAIADLRKRFLDIERDLDPEARQFESVPDHPLQQWACNIVEHPRLLDVLSRILGNDILLRNADLFIKGAQRPERIRWHADCGFPWQRSRNLLSAWIPLVDCSASNGTLRLLAGSHVRDIVFEDGNPHAPNMQPDQVERFADSEIRANIFSAGRVSIHGGRTVHSSHGNETDERRLVFVARFFSPEVEPEVSDCQRAYRVRGTTDGGPYQLRDTFPIHSYAPVRVKT